ncbi:hypothetical protein CsSME_00048689 [Camellia sinensis var. sinensis]
MGVNRLGKVTEPVLVAGPAGAEWGTSSCRRCRTARGTYEPARGTRVDGSRGRLEWLAWLADAERVGRRKRRLRRLGTRGERVMLKAEAGDAPATKIARDGACDGEMG